MMFVPIETAEVLCGVVFEKLIHVISESKKANTDIQWRQIEELQNVYAALGKHKKQIKNQLNQI